MGKSDKKKTDPFIKNEEVEELTTKVDELTKQVSNLEPFKEAYEENLEELEAIKKENAALKAAAEKAKTAVSPTPPINDDRRKLEFELEKKKVARDVERLLSGDVPKDLRAKAQEIVALRLDNFVEFGKDSPRKEIIEKRNSDIAAKKKDLVAAVAKFRTHAVPAPAATDAELARLTQELAAKVDELAESKQKRADNAALYLENIRFRDERIALFEECLKARVPESLEKLVKALDQREQLLEQEDQDGNRIPADPATMQQLEAEIVSVKAEIIKALTAATTATSSDPAKDAEIEDLKKQLGAKDEGFKKTLDGVAARTKVELKKLHDKIADLEAAAAFAVSDPTPTATPTPDPAAATPPPEDPAAATPTPAPAKQGLPDWAVSVIVGGAFLIAIIFVLYSIFGG